MGSRPPHKKRRLSPWSRRGFLKGCAGLVASLPLMNRAVMAQENSAKNLIILFAAGGWDISYALDPKPGLDTVDAPEGDTKLYGNLPIFAHESRPNVDRFFTDFGNLTAVVNGVEVSSIAHPECTKRILTGTNRETNPDVGAIAGFELGSELPIPYFILSNAAFTGSLAASSGRAGATNQIVDLLHETSTLIPGAGTKRFQPTDHESSLIARYLEQRRTTDKQQRGTLGHNRRQFEDYELSVTRANRLYDFRDSFGRRGVQLDIHQQLDLSVKLLEGEVCKAVITNDPSPWDSHTDNTVQGMLHENLYASLHTLASDLERKNLMDNTLVLVLSEMSRTPRLNQDGGKDHWPVTSSLLFGGGVAGGRAHGASTDTVEAAKIDHKTGELSESGTALRTENLMAGVLELLDIDSASYFPRAEPLQSLQG